MNWIGERISYIKNAEKTTVIITPEKIGFVRALISAWFVMWTVIGIILLWYFLTFQLKDQEKVILAVFGSFWLYYFIRVGKRLTWLFWGFEALKIDKIALNIKNSYRGFGKNKEYFLENIKKIKMDVPKDKSFQSAWENSPWLGGGDRFEFEYQGKIIRFGKKINSDDAKKLFQLITQQIDEKLKQRKKEA